MPVHDWSRVGGGVFHDFHVSWLLEIKRALRRGLLPPDHYAMIAEPSAGDAGVPDVLPDQVTARRQRSLVVRHASGDRVVATIEVVSRGNKSSRNAVRSMLDKSVAALDAGVNLLSIDVHPPGPRDPDGIHGLLMGEIGPLGYALGSERRLTAAAYVGGAVVEAFVCHFAVGEPLPAMPLFLTGEDYVTLPLEPAYAAAWEDVPAQWQAVLSAPG